MDTSTFAAFEQRQKEAEAREARRRASAGEETAEDAVVEQESSPQPTRRETPRVGRNEPCHCGSGKKFKKCHGA